MAGARTGKLVVRVAGLGAITLLAAAATDVQQTPSAAAPKVKPSSDDIVVTAKRFPLADGEWLVELAPPIEAAKPSGGRDASVASPQAGDPDGGAASDDTTASSTFRPGVRQWRFCLRGGDAYRMVMQLANVGQRPRGQSCDAMRMTFRSSHLIGRQVCFENVMTSQSVQRNRPLGDVVTSTVTMEGNYRPEGFDFIYRTELTRDDGMDAFDEEASRGGVGRQVRFSVSGKRIGACTAAPPAAVKPAVGKTPMP